MRQATITLYNFSELSDDAKERARNNWRTSSASFFDCDDEMNSIKVFCDYFNVKLLNYEVGGYCPISYRTDADNANFRGRKLKSFDRDHMPTGYWLDCSLWATFYDHFKKTGDAKEAFDQALFEGFKDLQKDMEWQQSDEYIDEFMEANEYEFYENGTLK